MDTAGTPTWHPCSAGETKRVSGRSAHRSERTANGQLFILPNPQISAIGKNFGKRPVELDSPPCQGKGWSQGQDDDVIKSGRYNLIEKSKTTDVKSQVDQCYESLRRLVVSWQIAPGERLTERELTKQLGYGRTPVREALLRLVQDRLIDTMPRSGYRVRPLTRKSVMDFFTVWRAFAPLLAKLAVPRMSAEHRSALKELGIAREKVKDGDSAELSRIASGFFEILIEAADNEPLTQLYRHLGAEMERIFQLYFTSEEGRRWLGTGAEISAFHNVTNEETAFRLIEDRVAASEKGFTELLNTLILETDTPKSGVLRREPRSTN